MNIGMEARQISAVSVGPVGEVWRCGGGAVVKAAQIRGIWIPADVDSVRPGVVGSLNFMQWRARPVMASSTPRPLLPLRQERGVTAQLDALPKRIIQIRQQALPANLLGKAIPSSQLTGNLRHRELGFHPAPPKTRRTRSSTTLFTVFTLSAQSRGPLDGYVPRGQPAFRDRRRRSPSKDHPLRNPIR